MPLNKLSKIDIKHGLRRATVLTIAVHKAISPERGDICDTSDEGLADFIYPIHICYQLQSVQYPQRFRSVIRAIVSTH